MKFIVPRSNIGRGAIVQFGDIRYHVPSWTVVLPETTIDDIIMEEKPFQELFKEEEQWEFTSSNGKDTYIVRYNKNNELSCSCWGYIAHKKCKHITEVRNGRDN